MFVVLTICLLSEKHFSATCQNRLIDSEIGTVESQISYQIAYVLSFVLIWQ